MTLKQRILRWYVSNEKEVGDIAAQLAAGALFIGVLAGIQCCMATGKDVSKSASETYDNVMYHKPTSEEILSRKRQKTIDCLLEKETPYHGNPEPLVKNQDGSVFVYSAAEGRYDTSGPGGIVWHTIYGYYRVDTKEGTQRKVAVAEEGSIFSYSNCYLSPNGNFLVLPRKADRDFILEPEIRMYDHAANELIWINTSRMEGDVRVTGVTDEGVLSVKAPVHGKETAIDYKNPKSYLNSSADEWSHRPVGYRMVLE